MRYKFRGKRKDNGEWVYGGLSKYNDENYFIVNTLKDYIGFITHMQEIIPETLGQYTGLTDKNGKEIYEGDVVECESPDGEMYITTVEWDRGAFIVDVMYCDYDYTTIGWALENDISEIEIIGNIRDNLELLSNG